MSTSGPKLPDEVEQAPPAKARKPLPPTNAAGLTGWAYVIDRLADKFFAPSFLAFVLIMATVFTLGSLVSGTVDLDRILKVWAFIGPLVGGYVGHAFTKGK